MNDRIDTLRGVENLALKKFNELAPQAVTDNERYLLWEATSAFINAVFKAKAAESWIKSEHLAHEISADASRYTSGYIHKDEAGSSVKKALDNLIKFLTLISVSDLEIEQSEELINTSTKQISVVNIPVSKRLLELLTEAQEISANLILKGADTRNGAHTTQQRGKKAGA